MYQNGLFTKNKDTLDLEEGRLILNVKAKTASLKSNFPNVSFYENEIIQIIFNKNKKRDRHKIKNKLKLNK